MDIMLIINYKARIRMVHTQIILNLMQYCDKSVCESTHKF